MADFTAELRGNTAFITRLLELMSNAQTSGLWDRVTDAVQAMLDTLYDQHGGAYGRDKWPEFSPTTIGKERIGTDGGKYGIYDESADPLEASGTYRRSFRTLNVTPEDLSWGSDHPLADTMPYRMWKYADGKVKGRSNQVWKYIQRYVLPDPNSGAFQDEVAGIHAGYVEDMVAQAIEETKGTRG